MADTAVALVNDGVKAVGRYVSICKYKPSAAGHLALVKATVKPVGGGPSDTTIWGEFCHV